MSLGSVHWFQTFTFKWYKESAGNGYPLTVELGGVLRPVLERMKTPHLHLNGMNEHLSMTMPRRMASWTMLQSWDWGR